MKIKVGNILKKQEIKIQLSFVQKMTVIYSSFYEYRLQNSMTPRYGAKLNSNEIIFDPPVYNNRQVLEAKCTWGIKLKIKS